MVLDVRWSKRRKFCIPPLGNDNDNGHLDDIRGLCGDIGVDGIGERRVVEDQREKEKKKEKKSHIFLFYLM